MKTKKETPQLILRSPKTASVKDKKMLETLNLMGEANGILEPKKETPEKTDKHNLHYIEKGVKSCFYCEKQGQIKALKKVLEIIRDKQGWNNDYCNELLFNIKEEIEKELKELEN